MKYLIHLILFFLIVTLIGCTEENNIDDENKDFDNIITIYSLNDFHGAIFSDGDEAGISKIGEYLIRQKTENPNSTVIISSGDMFQGTAVSSMTRGAVIVDAMNEIGFDSMTIGNHEFDWGIDGINRFIDGNNDNKEVKFPLLGANIYQKSTQNRATFAQPYTVIERGPVKIGIIGLIGEDQTSSILASIVTDYQFTDQMTEIKKYAKILRTEENCSVVIVSSHSDTTPINQAIADLDGDYKIDAVFNGHTHRYYAGETFGSRNLPLPYVQSGNNGTYIGKITLEIDPETKHVKDVSAENLKTKTHCTAESAKINSIINNYQSFIDLSNEVLGTAGQNIDRINATMWAAASIRKHADAEVGIVNSGGIRAAAFPIYSNSTVTFGNIFKMMPFENLVIKIKLTGAQIKEILSYNSDYVMSVINNESLDDSRLYTVATVDYVFEKTSLMKQGQDITNTNVLFRDYLVNEVKASVSQKGKWYLN